jgi:hypothetical protein
MRSHASRRMDGGAAKQMRNIPGAWNNVPGSTATDSCVRVRRVLRKWSDLSNLSQRRRSRGLC